MMRVIILLLITALFAIRGDDDCVPLEVTPGNIVCVCNATFCDYLTEMQMNEDQYISYTSTKTGERLQGSLASFSNEATFSDIFLTVNRNITFQTILGFGGAMTDAAALNIRNLSNDTQEKLIEAYYSNNGSRYIFCRIPIAGTDFSTRKYTYDDVPNDVTLSNFSLVEEDNYKIYYLKQIERVMSQPEKLKIFTTAWSAPAWMKNSNSLTWGSLKREYYQVYANYILKFFDAYKERGINIWGMTPGNEPLNGLLPFFPFNSMLWTPKTEAKFSVEYLNPTLQQAGYNNLVYMAMDDQRYEIPWYPDKIFRASKKSDELFTGTAVHWYMDDVFSPNRLDQLHYMYPDKFILMTEGCAGSNIFEKQKVKLGSWERGEQYLSDIIENLSHWVCGWVDWNLALDKHGAPNWAKNFVDSPIIVIPENDEFYKQPMYYALYHISRFVPPGSKRIFSSGLENYNGIKTIAFLTPEDLVVIVILNKDNNPHNITIRDVMMPDNLMHLQLSERSYTTLMYQVPQ